jgi:phospholipase C
MQRFVALFVIFAAGTLAASTAHAQHTPSAIGNIETLVLIYAENRSFDNLYGRFPGANGIANVTPANSIQRDRDGSVLKELPPIWGGLTAQVTQEQTAHLPNRPFAIDDPNGFNTPLSVATRDLWHRFYQNQMQINGGMNDRFAAYANAGALAMGYYDGSRLPLWDIAKKYVLADNFFQAAFGGSLLNHIVLVCACVPIYPNADQSPAREEIAAVEPDGISLTVTATSPRSALNGSPKFVRDGAIAPDFYVVNTMQPPY